jgi:hypothetical protein
VIAEGWETVMAAMRQNEYHVLCGCCDGASDNRKFLQGQLTHGGNGSCRTYYVDPVSRYVCPTVIVTALCTSAAFVRLTLRWVAGSECILSRAKRI